MLLTWLCAPEFRFDVWLSNVLRARRILEG
jgi:hypothetical protein